MPLGRGRQHHPKNSALLLLLGEAVFLFIFWVVVLPPLPFDVVQCSLLCVGAAVLPPSLGVVLLSSLGVALPLQTPNEKQGQQKKNKKRKQG